MSWKYLVFNIWNFFQNWISLVFTELFYSWQNWPGNLAQPRLGFDRVEQGGDGEPDHGGEHESGDLVLDHTHLAAAVSGAGDVDKAR